jgi:hypothetical protein
MSRSVRLIILIALGLLPLLSACANGGLTPDQINATAAILVQTMAVEAAGSATPATPVETPTPEVQEVVLVTGQSSDPGQAALAAEALAAFASGQGWFLREVAEVASASITAATRLVVVLGTNGTEITAQANAHPDTQFIAVAIDGLGPADNLTVLSTSGISPAEQGFIAGYYSVIFNDQYRVGAITVSEGSGSQVRDGYINGALYFCGLCSPGVPPFYNYPLTEEVPAAADFNTLQNAARALLDSAVQIIFLAPGTAHPDLVRQLADQGVLLIGTGRPSGGEESLWGLTVSGGDLPATLEHLVPQVLAAGGQGTITLEPAIWHNPDKVSTARYANGLRIIEELSQGIIDPLGE